MGCKSFALLFDDIEEELSPADKRSFTSFAEAQVHVTNLIYEHLGQPEIFLFCPTGNLSARDSVCLYVSFAIDICLIKAD